MRGLIHSFLFLLIISGSLFAKYEAEFLDLGAGARALALGGAFSAICDDPTASLYNPAGLVQTRFLSFNLMHTSLYSDIYRYETFSFGRRFGFGTVGAVLQYLGTDNIPFTTGRFYDWGVDMLPGTADAGEGNGVWDPGERAIYDVVMKKDTDIAGGVSFAHRFGRLSFGTTGKYLHQDIGGYTASGFGADIGALYDISDRGRLAFVLKDAFGTRIFWSTGHREIKSPVARLAGAYKIPVEKIHGEATVAVDLETHFTNIPDAPIRSNILSVEPHIGAELALFDIFFIRGGLDRKYPTAGAGLRFFVFEVDYAFKGHSLGNTHRVSLTVDLNEPKKEIEEISVPVETVAVAPETTKVEIEEIVEPEPEPEISLPLDERIGIFHFETAAVECDIPDTLVETIKNFLSHCPECFIEIQGHADDRKPKPTVPFKDNLELSIARAEWVKGYLTNKTGFPADCFHTRGFGDTKPAMPGKTGEARAKNRRVEVYLKK